MHDEHLRAVAYDDPSCGADDPATGDAVQEAHAGRRDALPRSRPAATPCCRARPFPLEQPAAAIAAVGLTGREGAQPLLRHHRVLVLAEHVLERLAAFTYGSSPLSSAA